MIVIGFFTNRLNPVILKESGTMPVFLSIIRAMRLKFRPERGKTLRIARAKSGQPALEEFTAFVLAAAVVYWRK